PYPLPRAVHFDDEIGRVFQSMGLTEEVKAISEGVPDHYEWRNADGASLAVFVHPTSQPCFEGRLAGSPAPYAGVRLRRHL
ncbi:MAG: monooxygenase, partial [Amycolatopsis sp.]|uniref:hypothetical protein n=1 Tax=Amycolatopsis sp. TaxID=37632 RepID=UPI002625088A